MEQSGLNFAWIINGDLAGSAPPEVVAGFRFCAFIPARILGREVLTFKSGMDPKAFLDGRDLAAVVIIKPLHADFLRLIEECRRRGIKTIVHLSDWYFEHDVSRKIAAECDAIVVQTSEIARYTEQFFGRKPLIIEEAYEGPRGAPKFAPAKVPRLLWYGHSANLDTLHEGVRQLGRLSAYEFGLLVITDNPNIALDAIRDAKPKCKITLSREVFTLERQWKGIENCDFVLIPSIPTPQKVVKGHNRLVQAIHGGRLALAYPLPQYRELADFCWCGEDQVDGLRWALKNREEAVLRIERGQAYIDSRFAPEVVARKWETEVAKVLGRVP